MNNVLANPDLISENSGADRISKCNNGFSY